MAHAQVVSYVTCFQALSFDNIRFNFKQQNKDKQQNKNKNSYRNEGYECIHLQHKATFSEAGKFMIYPDMRYDEDGKLLTKIVFVSVPWNKETIGN